MLRFLLLLNNINCQKDNFNKSTCTVADVKLLNAVSGGSPDVVRFLTVMSICNTVIPLQR